MVVDSCSLASFGLAGGRRIVDWLTPTVHRWTRDRKLTLCIEQMQAGLDQPDTDYVADSDLVFTVDLSREYVLVGHSNADECLASKRFGDRDLAANWTGQAIPIPPQAGMFGTDPYDDFRRQVLRWLGQIYVE